MSFYLNKLSNSPQARLELFPRCDMRNRRTRDYIADISHDISANTPTPYLFTAVVRLAYLREGETEFSFAWAMVPTYASNCLTSADVPIQEGAPIVGILLPTFGSYTDAAFSTCGAVLSSSGETRVYAPLSSLPTWIPTHGRVRPYIRLALPVSSRRKLRRVSPACA